MTKVSGDEWRLTEHGLLARADLGVSLDPKLTRDQAAFIGSRQRVIDFVMKAGSLENQPPVHGVGTLFALRRVAAEPGGATKTAGPTQVNLTHAADIAAAFRDAILPMVEAIVGGSGNWRLPLVPQLGVSPFGQAIDCGRFIFTGPHFVPFGSESHEWVGWHTGVGQHDSSPSWPASVNSRSHWVVPGLCMEWIKESDMFFAWISATDCHATLLELG